MLLYWSYEASSGMLLADRKLHNKDISSLVEVKIEFF